MRKDVALTALLLLLSTPILVFTLLIGSRYFLIPATAIGGVSVFVISQRKGAWTPSGLLGTRGSMALSIVFFNLLLLGTLLLRSAEAPHQRSLVHFVASAGLFGVVACHCVVGYLNRVSRILYLSEALLAAFWTRLAQQLVFPGVIGIDSWFHLGIVRQILTTGHVPTNTVYSGLAQFHVLAAMLSITSNLPAAVPLEYLVAAISTSAGIFVFLIGERVLETRVGLAATIVAGFDAQSVAVGSQLLASTLAIVFLSMSLFLFLRYFQERRASTLVLSFVPMVALILTHTFVAFLLLALLVSFVVGNMLARYLKLYQSGPNKNTLRGGTLALLFGVAMFGWWGYVSGTIANLGAVIRFGFRYEPWTPTATSVAYLGSVPLSEYSLNLLGTFLVVALAIGGSLVYLFGKRFQGVPLGMFTSIWSLAVVGFLSISAGVSGLLGLRWILGFEILAGLPAGIILLELVNRSKHKRAAALGVTLLIAIASFASLTSPTANTDTIVYSTNTSVRLAFTESELAALESISALDPHDVGVVYPDFYYFQFYQSITAIDIGPVLQNKSFGNLPQGLVILRADIRDSPFYYTQTISRLDYDPISILSSQNSRMYDDGSVVAILVSP